MACGEDGDGGRAAALNALFDEWKRARSREAIEGVVKFGTVDWLFHEYKQTKAYLEKVSQRSRRDYERTMLLVTELITKQGDRIGDRKVKAISPRSADKIYERIIEGPRGLRPRQGEKVVGLCARAWSVVHRLHPTVFNHDIPNPWRGVTKNRRTKAIKPAATREQVYAFTKKAIELGYPEPAAAAVICFEWLQLLKTCCRVTLGGRTTVGGRRRPQFASFIIRPEQSCSIRYKTAMGRSSTQMPRKCWPRSRGGAFR
jgi:hypothetical protein